MDIKNKTIVLTGATGGIGRAIARRTSAAGARLILVARDAERLASLLGQLPGKGHRAVSADLTSDSGRSKVVEACRVTTDVALVINCAGINDFGLFEEQSAESVSKIVDVNLISPMLLCLDLLPTLRQQPEALIVNIGSTFGSIGYPGFSTYCATKFGLRGFTEALRRELADSTVHVSYIAPRATRTDLNSDTIVAMNDALGTTMDDPALVADEVMRDLRATTGTDKYLGWPEKLFVRINAVFPGLVDNSLRKQLPIIRRFAGSKT
ncbi:MAG: SDR family oxidoreductase [Woeseiaceae bacterium]|jgi:short-subunit dehydrogenase